MCIIDQSQQITPAQNVSAMKMPESHSKEVRRIAAPSAALLQEHRANLARVKPGQLRIVTACQKRRLRSR